MFRRVLIAFDHSPQAILALKVARTHFPEAERRLLTVVEESDLPRNVPNLVPTSAAAQTSAAQALDDLKEVTWPQESSRVVIGRRASTLLRAARAFEADLLVIGTHGRQGLNRWLSGSVAEEVVRKASMPVLVIREASVTGDGPDGEVPQPAASPVGAASPAE